MTESISSLTSEMGLNFAQFELARQIRNELYPASGVIHTGRHWASANDANNRLIGEGLWIQDSVGSENTLFWGINDSSGQAGTSKERDPVINVNGVEITLAYTNSSTTINRIAFADAPDAVVDEPTTVNPHNKHDFVIDGLTGDQAYICIQDAPAGILLSNTAYYRAVPYVTRTDLAGVEVFLVELGADNIDIAYPYGNTQYGPSQFEGVTLANNIIAQGYSSFGDWDTLSRGYGIRWSTLKRHQKRQWVRNPKNNIYKKDGKYYQWHYRLRTIRGLGSQWKTTDPYGTKYLEFSNGADYVRPQGKQTTPQDYSQTFPVYLANKRSDRAFEFENGTFAASLGTNVPYTAAAVNGECYFIPICTVKRRNKGVYDPFHNELGTRKNNRSDDTNNTHWYSGLATLPTNLEGCFTNATGSTNTAGYHIDTGYVSSNQSSRYDGLFYDIIYAEDVDDLRIRVTDITTSSLDNRLFDYVSDKVRGMEYMPILHTTKTGGTNNTVTVSGSCVTDIGAGGNIRIPISASDQDISAENLEFQGLRANKWILVGSNGEVQIINRPEVDPGADIAQWPHFNNNAYLYGIGTSANRLASIAEEFNSKFPPGTVLSILAESTSTIPMGKTVGEIISTPAVIKSILTMKNKDSIMGYFYTPSVPDGVSTNFKLWRKSNETIIDRILTGDGVTWVSSTINVNEITNELDPFQPDASIFQLNHFKTSLNPFEKVNIASMDDIELSSVVATNHQGKSHGAHFCRNLTEYVPVNASGLETSIGAKLTSYRIEPSTKMFSTADVYSPSHTYIKLGGSSHGVKAFLYEHVDEYGLIWDYIVFKQLKYDVDLDSELEFINRTGTSLESYVEGSYYRISGVDPIVSVRSLSTLGSSQFNTLTRTTDGFYVYNGTPFFQEWDGDGFGDDNKFNIVNANQNILDNNGNYVLVGCVRSKRPRGFKRLV